MLVTIIMHVIGYTWWHTSLRANYVNMRHDYVACCLHAGIDNSHVNIIILHVDIIYLACSGQSYTTIEIKSTLS